MRQEIALSLALAALRRLHCRGKRDLESESALRCETSICQHITIFGVEGQLLVCRTTMSGGIMYFPTLWLTQLYFLHSRLHYDSFLNESQSSVGGPSGLICPLGTALRNLIFWFFATLTLTHDDDDDDTGNLFEEEGMCWVWGCQRNKTKGGICPLMEARCLSNRVVKWLVSRYTHTCPITI